MPISLALSQNGLFAAPGGAAFTMSASSDTEALGVVPLGVTSVSADVSADYAADVHLALLYAPQAWATNDGSAPLPDGETVTDVDPNYDVVVRTYQADLLGVGIGTQTLTVQIPTTKAPAVYVVRLWVDNIVGLPSMVQPGVNVASVYVS